jgi:hypothetical protein
MANNRFPRFLEIKVTAGLAGLFFLAGCSTPKPAVVSASPTPPPSAVVPPSAATAATQNPVAANDVVKSDSDKADRYVAAVRESTMSGYPAATIGKAFEAAFRDFKWQSRTADGVQIVNFTGTLPDRVRQDCVGAKEAPRSSPCAQDAKVTFQWTFTSDGRFFHLSYIDPEPWPEARRSTREMLLFIYG